MGVLCDTMVAQRIIADKNAAAYARRAAGTPGHLYVSPLSIEQQVQGWCQAGRPERASETARAYAALLDDGVVGLAPIDETAAIVAGRVRGTQPGLPLPAARRPRRTKPERRVSWTFDVLIAASAWAAGSVLASADEHLRWLAGRLLELYPEEPLELLDPLPHELMAHR